MLSLGCSVAEWSGECKLLRILCCGGDQLTVISWALLYSCAVAEYRCTVEE